MKKSYAAAVALLALFGAARIGFEQRLTEEYRAAFFHGAKFNLGMRQQIGQSGFLAALSGFRCLVADYLWIKAEIAWEHTEYGRMLHLFNNVTALEPRNVMFWDMSAWHMGWNASVYALNNPKQPRQALRIKAQREYFRVAEDFLIRGIQNNPDRYKLYESLATLYKEKFSDHCKAAEYYEKAAQFPNSPSYEKRFAAYQLAECPGHEKEAYDKMVKLYKMGQNEWLPSLLLGLKSLQEKLKIPPDQRVYNSPGK